MHPLHAWWHARSSASCGEDTGCGPQGGGGRWHGGGRHGSPFGDHGHGGGHHGSPFGDHGGGGDDGGSFGVRRPLRFLAYKLDLDERQVTELAAILAELKTERAQAAVDERRSVAALADVVAAETFDADKAGAATGERVKSAEAVQKAVAKAVGRIHALLQPEQRAKLAYLLRTGALMI
jgi:Spy/CpxP family protein refolding chaperone